MLQEAKADVLVLLREWDQMCALAPGWADGLRTGARCGTWGALPRPSAAR